MEKFTLKKIAEDTKEYKMRIDVVRKVIFIRYPKNIRKEEVTEKILRELQRRNIHIQ